MGSLSNLSVLETRFYNIFQKYYKGIHRKVLLKSKLKVSLRRMKLPRRAVILKNSQSVPLLRFSSMDWHSYE